MSGQSDSIDDVLYMPSVISASTCSVTNNVYIFSCSIVALKQDRPGSTGVDVSVRQRKVVKFTEGRTPFALYSSR